MSAIDYVFADPVAVPLEMRRHFAEQVFDLPSAICFEQPDCARPVSPLPSLEGKPFTFGCLNRMEKMSDRALAAWGRIMKKVPKAQLLIKDRMLDDSQARERLLQRLETHGIPRGRARMLGWTTQAMHLQVFHEVDLALDPFPMNGGVSSAEALWMGVPVVTWLGATLPGRSTASMLTVLGMKEWIARDEAEYVRIAIEMAGNRRRLARVRQGLRAKMANSYLGDVRRYTRAVEGAYRRIWRRWCKGRSVPSKSAQSALER